MTDPQPDRPDQDSVQIDEVLYLRRAVVRERNRAAQAEDVVDRLGALADQLSVEIEHLKADNDRLANTIAALASNQGDDEPQQKAH